VATADSYSYERYSSDLGLSQSNALRLAITNKRNLATTSARRIADALGMTHEDRKYFLLLVRQNNARAAAERERLFQELLRLKAATLPTDSARVKLAYYSDWYNPIIREMAGMADFRSDPGWISRRLYNKILPRQAEKSLELLTRLGLIAYDRRRGRHVKTGGDVIVDRHFDHIAMARHHQRMIELARDSVLLVPEEERDLNALTICIPESLARRLQEWTDQLVDQALSWEREAGVEEPKHVYQLNTNLFRLTKGPRKRRHRHGA
jgi:uncharacterized protein (TIGR02147 family)